MNEDEEVEKIEEVYFYIKWEGPIHVEELVELGLESEEHLRRITRRLERVGKIDRTENGWVPR